MFQLCQHAEVAAVLEQLMLQRWLKVVLCLLLPPDGTLHSATMGKHCFRCKINYVLFHCCVICMVFLSVSALLSVFSSFGPLLVVLVLGLCL